MDFEPGPSLRDPMPLGPRVVTPGLFGSLAADLVGALGGADVGLGAASATLTPAANTEFPAALDQAAADAANSLGALGTSDEGAMVAAARDAGDGVGTDADQQAGTLPGPDEAEPDVGIDGPIEHEPRLQEPPPEGLPPGPQE
jgi:hypothetical protein